MSDYGIDEVQHRFFFHLRGMGDRPERWRHGEHTPSDGGAGPIPFDFYWVRLDDELPELIADMSQLLGQLRPFEA
jgi:hypothetical protein